MRIVLMVEVEKSWGKQVIGLVETCYFLLAIFSRLFHLDLVLFVQFISNIFLYELDPSGVTVWFFYHLGFLA